MLSGQPQFAIREPALVQRPLIQSVAPSGRVSVYNRFMEDRADRAAGKAVSEAHAHEKATAELPPWKSAVQLGAGVGLLGLGFLIRRKAPLKTSFNWISTDPRSWLQIGLGIAAMSQLKKGLNWEPPPWLGALATIGLLSPMTMGFSVKTLGQMGVMAPVIAGVVQATDAVNKVLPKKLEQEYNIPPLATKLVVMLGTMGLGMGVYPNLYKGVASTGVLGQAAKNEALKTGAGATGATQLGAVCTRGCCNSLVCMSEVGEMVAASGVNTNVVNWFNPKERA